MSEKSLNLLCKLFPTTSVGSLPQTDGMRKFRSEVRKGGFSKEYIEGKEFGWVESNIDLQMRWGLDVLVDGEPYREDMVAYFARMWGGFKPGGFVRSYGNRYYRKPVICSELEWSPATVKYWRHAQQLAAPWFKQVKGIVTGPYTLMDWSFNEYYRDRRDTTLALAAVVKQEVEALAEAGAKIIQIDEPAISVRPDELGLAFEAMEIVTDIKNRGDVYFISHLCYGEFDKIYPEILSLAVDQLDLEVSNSGFDLFKMFEVHPFTKDIGLGVFDVHRYGVVSVDMIGDRVNFALKYLRPDQIWVDPDCGQKTRGVEETDRQMRNMVIAAQFARNEAIDARKS